VKRPDTAAVAPTVPTCVIALVTRDRARAALRLAFPRRVAALHLVRTRRELAAAFRRHLVDAAIVDLASPTEDTVAALDLAREFPSAPFIGLTPLRPSDTSLVARAAGADFSDVVVEHVDDSVLRHLVEDQGFTRRFSRALQDPPESLLLTSRLQRQAWGAVVAHGGRPIVTDVIAQALGVSREHLSRVFSVEGAPNIKRVIDLVRLIAAAELAKNPGYDIGDVAGVLGFASSSHLSTAAIRIAGTRPTSLARLRAVDLIERFVKDRSRSRNAAPRPPAR
jgi:AraC-like DNA-binding protein